MKIKIKRGLTIPISGEPKKELEEVDLPTRVALDLSPFYQLRLKIQCKEGDEVSIGQPLVFDACCPKRVFTAPT